MSAPRTARTTVRALAGVLAAVVLGPVALVATTSTTAPAATAASARSPYLRSVLRDRPTAVLHGLRDLTGGASGRAVGRPRLTRLPNGDRAYRFDGRGQYLAFPDRRAFSVAATGVLTVEFWMRPDRLRFQRTEGSGYVHLLGKGRPGAHEWYVRMYSRANTEGRRNRISGYAFNPTGGLGAGSYFQDAVRRHRWIHVALVIDSRSRSRQHPLGVTRIYKNGVLRDTDSLAAYGIVPRRGNAPLRVGTGNLGSFFRGAVGDIAFYDRALPASRIRAHRRAGSW